MDLRRTRTFVTVAELGTVSKAALHLRIAQPALSRQISDLEEELGLRLFDRVGRRLLLTSVGEQLLSDCRGLLNYASAIGERAQLLRHGDTGVLKVAASPQHIESVFADFLHRYGQRYPNVQVKLFDAVGPEMFAMLERGDIHLGQSLVHAVQPDDLRFGSLPLEPVDMLAACHPPLSLGKGQTIEIDRLASYPLLLMDSEFVVRRTFDAACRLARLKPNILLESRAPHTLLALAEAGLGVAIVPSALQVHRYELQIVAVTYRGRPLREPLAILWDKRRPRTRYAADFCEMLAEHVRVVFPITRPSEPKTDAKGRAVAARRARRKATRDVGGERPGVDLQPLAKH
jgi:DNA-binding transcriptional LysR family regulator